uniref:Uncharacterized protein n=1 Tax=Plectus sambesii TaxID=2011161 RepID=A0A914XQW2_9BILA
MDYLVEQLTVVGVGGQRLLPAETNALLRGIVAPHAIEARTSSEQGDCSRTQSTVGRQQKQQRSRRWPAKQLMESEAAETSCSHRPSTTAAL